MSLDLKPYDPVDYLTDDETISYYLIEAFEENNARAFSRALADVIRAKGGVQAVAERTGVAPEILSVACSENGNPDLSTILSVLAAFQVRVSARRSDAAHEPLLSAA